MEVRVGNVDAGAITPIGQRICANALCKNISGGQTKYTHLEDCSGGPLPGRYVTVQRYFLGVNNPALVLTELDVKFYNI